MFCPPPDLINNQEYDIIEKNTKRRRQLPRESDQSRPDILICPPEECEAFLREHSDQGCADAGLEVAGGKHPFDEGIDKSACIYRLLALEGAIEGCEKAMLPEHVKADLKEFYQQHKKH